jgi:hypothetical protein
MKLPPAAYRCAALLTALVLGTTIANASGACLTHTYGTERSKLQSLLAAKNYPKVERVFLISGADQRVREIRPNMLNARGTDCGVDAVRALILSCLNDGLPSALRSGGSPHDRKTGASMWGKVNVSAREGTFIGIFHACRGAAIEAFLAR